MILKIKPQERIKDAEMQGEYRSVTQKLYL